MYLFWANTVSFDWMTKKEYFRRAKNTFYHSDDDPVVVEGLEQDAQVYSFIEKTESPTRRCVMYGDSKR